MTKKVLLITMLIVLHFRNIVAMTRAADEYSAGENNTNFCLTQPMNHWKNLSPLTNDEMKIYKKTWNYKATLNRNKSDLADIFCDICCDFSFSLLGERNNVVYGKSISNPNIIFIRSIASINSFIENDFEKYAITNFLDNVGYPRRFTFEMREQIRQQVRTIAEDSVGCKLLRIATSKIARGNLPKLIFIPLEKDSMSVSEDGMNVHSGIYGWQIEYDRFMSRMRFANTIHEKFSEIRNQPLDFKKYSQMKLPRYNYILFSPENFFRRPIVTAIRKIGPTFEFFKVKFPMDATLFRTIVRSLYFRRSGSQMNIKARLNVKKKKFSQRLNQKFNSMLSLLTEADCLTKLSPQIFRQIKKFGGVRNYATWFVKTMTESARLENIENIVSDYYTDDEEYRAQYGVTSEGFDSLNESSYLSHRYQWIRASNLIRIKNEENFENVYETFLQEQGDFDLYSYFLSPSSSIKYPVFGVNQYQYTDDSNSTAEYLEKGWKKEKKQVRFLPQQSNKRGDCFFRG